MMEVAFTCDKGKVHTDLAAIALTIVDGVQLSCSSFACTDATIRQPDLLGDFTRYRRMFISYKKLKTIAEQDCLSAVVKAIQSNRSSLLMDLDNIEHQNLSSSVKNSNANFIFNSLTTSVTGIRLEIEGVEMFCITDLSEFPHASVTLTMRENSANLFVVAQGFKRGFEEPVCWYKQEIMESSELVLEFTPTR